MVGHRAEWVTKTLVEHAPPGLAIEFVEQVEQRGTGDAMSVALTGLPDEDDGDDGDVVVLPGDTPLLRPGTLAALVRAHRAEDDAATLLTAVLDDPTGYGRVVRGRDDAVARVVEDGDATDEELEVARGQHLDLLLPAQRAGPVAAPAQPGQRPGRVLPDRRGRGPLRGRPPGAARWSCADTMEVAGVNDRAQLAVAEAELRDRINERWMRRGVTMWDPETHLHRRRGRTWRPTWSCSPGSSSRGPASVGEHAEIGPDTRLVDTVVGEGAVVASSVCRRSVDRRRRPGRPLRRAGPRATEVPAGRRWSGPAADLSPGAGRRR